MQAGVLGLVDDTHAATAQLLDDAVVRDGLADHVSRKVEWAGAGQVKGGSASLK